MPEAPFSKERPHPAKQDAPKIVAATHGLAYAELAVTSNYTFLTGASHPEELVRRAAELGYCAIAMTDLHTVAGIVRAHVAASQAGIALAVGCEIRVRDVDASLLIYPTDRASYGRMCRLLTIGKRRTVKGECHLELQDVAGHHAGLLAVMRPTEGNAEATAAKLGMLREVFDGDRLSLAVRRGYGPDDEAVFEAAAAAGRAAGVPLAAINGVRYHAPERRALQDVLTCIRAGVTLDQAGRLLCANAERYLKPPEEMHRLFASNPRAIARSVDIARRAAAGFSLDHLRYEYPDEVVPVGSTAQEHLEQLVRRGAAERYRGEVPAAVAAQIRHELNLIAELRYAPYFLTVYDIVRFARSRDILCQGRGAAANSAVCYCLGVTAVDPDRIDVLFERFISKERNEPPDIDIDFEHERREEVIQYIYAKYGRDRAALTAEVISYRGRSAVRDVGKAMGLSLDLVDRLAKTLDWWERGVVQDGRLKELGLNPGDPTLRRVIALTEQLLGFPRHLSQHVGGFIISRGPLCEVVPIENAAMADRTVIEWDKDDIDAVGLLKVDCLGLGMLTCIARALAMVNGRRAGRAAGSVEGAESAACEVGREADGSSAVPFLTLASIPAEDPVVYDMICKADTVGVFQIESRAQMSMLPRLRPRCFYDLVIEVAIVRPGPIQGKMVHPYLRRRNGEEAISYPDDRVKRVLGKTLGVPLFQEQAMQLAIVAAGFTPGEADQLRRAMAAWKRKGDLIFRFGQKIIDGMTARGYDREFADRCFEQIKGFSEYGFPESHAASFALLVYVSAWLKRHHPAAFVGALINSQPMGFYAPAQLVRDAREHGVEVRETDINHSQWDCTLEETAARRVSGGPPVLRLGLRMVRGLARDEAERVVAAVKHHGAFASVLDLWRASGVRVASLRAMAGADAFGSMKLDRQQALWAIRGLRDESLPLFDPVDLEEESEPERREAAAFLPAIPMVDQVTQDYWSTGLSLKAHPISFIREGLRRRGCIPNAWLSDEVRMMHGRRVAVAGIVLVRQRPGTASGIVFMTLEDESGVANLIIRPKIYDAFRRAARHSVGVLARGRVERQGAVVHVHVSRVESLDAELSNVAAQSRNFH